ncbi:MAG: PIG-L family deacetylase, partial [Bacteroidia bacterium]
MNGKKVLVLAPHTDDGELGCGGSINRKIEEGSEVYYVAFSI